MNSVSFDDTDINDCALGTHTCHKDAVCTDTTGSYSCTCKEGYAGDGESCTGIIKQHFMHSLKENPIQNSICFTLHCLYCFLDINECYLSNACHPNSNCSNTLGSYICECNPGYSGDGKTCAGMQYNSACKPWHVYEYIHL